MTPSPAHTKYAQRAANGPHARRSTGLRGMIWTLAPLVIGVTGVLIFLIWLILTFGPILRVEAKYQTQRLFRDVFRVTSFQSIFIPDISLDLRGANAENTQNGIVIPKIFVDEPIIYNVDPNDEVAYTAALKKGIAHASSTSFPDSSGLGYYFAHSSRPELQSQYNAVFYLLGKLELGDTVFIWHEGEQFEYAVSDIVTTSPTDLGFLQQNYPKETIVMQTCWPAGSNLQRRLVFAERVL